MKLLYAMDDGPDGAGALENIVRQARKCRAHVVLLDVIDTLPMFEEAQPAKPLPSQLKNSLLRERLDRLESFIMMNSGGATELRSRVLFGNRAHEIARTAGECGIDLVIKHREPGATDRALAQHCPCPVLLCAPGTLPTADGILDALSSPQRKQAVA